jgi:tetratricopeptide (TPR) repeat protein
MTNTYTRSGYLGRRVHWKQTIYTAILAVVILTIASIAILFFRDWRDTLGNEKQELAQLWESGIYDKAFVLSGEMLVSRPMDHFLLTVRGFSAYQLAISQINHYDTQTYIDASIWALRRALLVKETPEVHYVLGKAYFYKGFGYADLAVHFLEVASQAGYDATDIPEYLGLAYAAIHDYRNSVAAFTLALKPLHNGGDFAGDNFTYPPDLLFLAIARSYLALGELESAQAYLMRCIETSRDAKRVIAARMLVGDILRKSGDLKGAEAQFLAVTLEGGENSIVAEAHYQLGEIYYASDITKARAEWRKSIRIDPAHRQARMRLN